MKECRTTANRLIQSSRCSSLPVSMQVEAAVVTFTDAQSSSNKCKSQVQTSTVDIGVLE